MHASQMGQSTTGHNIANVDTDGFSRQEITQAAAKPMSDGKGTGVNVTGVRRIQDQFTKEKVVDEQTFVGTWTTREKTLTEAEILYTDLEGSRLRGALDEFWGAWGSVANEPESATLRKSLLVKAQELTTDVRSFDSRLTDFNETLNARITAEIQEVNQITREVAILNKQVEQLEKRGLQANDARDRRELLLQQLAEKIELRWFESGRGTLEVQIPNGEHLVHGRKSFALTPMKTAVGAGDIRIGLTTASSIDSDITDIVKEGSLKELINQRDGNIRSYQEDLNEMTKEIAFRVNQLHTGGTGISGIKTSEISTYPMSKEAIERPLPYLKTGSFEIKLLDDDQNISEILSIDLEAGVDTLESVVRKINQAGGAYETTEDGREVLKEVAKFKAEINGDGTISISSGLGQPFIYGKDETNILTVLGLNCFFHFTKGASDIRVNPELEENEMKIVAGSDLIPGDNRIAIEIAELQFKSTMGDGTISFDEFYNSQITDIGLKVLDAQKGLESHTQMLEQYEALRDAVSSVNLDEEMTKMVKYQRAYESSAKFMSTIDQMTQTLVNM